jgi:hypothetical protein
MTPDMMVEKYILLRDRVAEIKKEHAVALSPYTQAMAFLEVKLLEVLHTNRVEQFRALSGTVFKSKRTSAKVTDWQETLAFIRDKEAWDLLEARVSKLAVEAVLADLEAQAQLRRQAGEVVSPEDLLIPGVAVTQEDTVNVRKPTT